MTIMKFTPDTILAPGDKVLVEAMVYSEVQADGTIALAIGDGPNSGVYATRSAIRAVLDFDYPPGSRVFLETLGQRGTVEWADADNVLVRADNGGLVLAKRNVECRPRRTDEPPSVERNPVLIPASKLGEEEPKSPPAVDLDDLASKLDEPDAPEEEKPAAPEADAPPVDEAVRKFAPRRGR